MMSKTGWVALCAAGVLACAGSAGAAEWTLTNTQLACNNGGLCSQPQPPMPNGHVVQVDDGFKLVGDDTSHIEAIATYTTIAEQSADLTFAWDYFNYEPVLFGSGQDPAGFVIDGVLTQLTINTADFCCFAWDPLCTIRAQSGTVTFSVAAGQTYGFYVKDLDGGYGAGEITVRSAVPEPTSWALMLVGFFGLGSILRGARPTRRSAHW
jgi:hypothetical protein